MFLPRCFSVIVLLTLVVACSESAESSKARATSNAVETRESHNEAIEVLKKILVKDFKDPDSAQFKGVMYYGIYAEGRDGKNLHVPGMDAICGEVNAKNSFGGYIGYRQFLVSSVRPEGGTPALTSMVEDNSSPTLQRLFLSAQKQVCKDTIVPRN